MSFASQLFPNVPEWFVTASLNGEPKPTVIERIKKEINQGIIENNIVSKLWTDEFILSYAETIFQIYSEQMSKRKP